MKISDQGKAPELPVWAEKAARVAYDAWHNAIIGTGVEMYDIIPSLPWDEVPDWLRHAWITAVYVAHEYVNGYVSGYVAAAVGDPRGEQLSRALAALGQISSGDNAGCPSPREFAAVVLADVQKLDP